jgi:hypothetical protein
MEKTIESGSLTRLRDILATVVTTLDEIGADGFRDAYVYVTGCQGGRLLGELSLQRGDIWVSTGTATTAHPDYIHADESGNRRALLLSSVCYAMWHWHLTIDDVAAYLGCGSHTLERWFAQSVEATAAFPPSIGQRLRRLIVVEELRLLSGVADAVVADWIRVQRIALGGRSILSVLTDDGEVGFRKIAVLMLDAVAASSATIH